MCGCERRLTSKNLQRRCPTCAQDRPAHGVDKAIVHVESECPYHVRLLRNYGLTRLGASPSKTAHSGSTPLSNRPFVFRFETIDEE